MKKDIPLSDKATIELDARHETLVRWALAFAEEMEPVALTAPEGTVFQACEQAVLNKCRKSQSQMLGDAVAGRLKAVEKKLA